jgi:chemotaxis protein CheY-P-specific phosphatase CheC
MPSDLTPDALGAVAARVLEDAAFLFVEAAGDDGGASGPRVVAAMDFGGPAPGQLHLAVPPDLAAELAANLLGVEPDDPEAADRGEAAVGELLNMIGGVLTAETFGTDVVCPLGIPVVRVTDPGEAPASEIAVASRLVDENGRAVDVWVVR